MFGMFCLRCFLFCLSGYTTFLKFSFPGESFAKNCFFGTYHDLRYSPRFAAGRVLPTPLYSSSNVRHAALRNDLNYRSFRSANCKLIFEQVLSNGKCLPSIVCKFAFVRAISKLLSKMPGKVLGEEVIPSQDQHRDFFLKLSFLLWLLPRSALSRPSSRTY